VILASCSNKIKSDKETAFSELFPEVSFNKEFRQTVVRNEINQKNGPSIYLRLENLSSSIIVFPEDFGVKIFTYSKEQKEWLELRNDSVYITNTIPMLKPKNQGPLRFMGVPLSPVIEGTGHEISIRIVVVGTVYEDDKATDRLTGAYTDLTLSP
jgi:hypothetical protein